MMDTRAKVAESNRIEGIHRAPTDAEIAEHERFVALAELSVDELVRFVGVYQPDARLRLRIGMNVRVGDHLPPPGGTGVGEELARMLDLANASFYSPWATHVWYETLHPFTDGNGRSGRALWYWMMERHDPRLAAMGFLHAFYYQTLQNCGRESRPVLHARA